VFQPGCCGRYLDPMGKWRREGWRELHNDKLHDAYTPTNIIRVITSKEHEIERARGTHRREWRPKESPSEANGQRGKIILKVSYRNTTGGCKWDSSGQGQPYVAGYWEHDNERSGSTKWTEFLDCESVIFSRPLFHGVGTPTRCLYSVTSTWSRASA